MRNLRDLTSLMLNSNQLASEFLFIFGGRVNLFSNWLHGLEKLLTYAWV